MSQALVGAPTLRRAFKTSVDFAAGMKTLVELLAKSPHASSKKVAKALAAERYYPGLVSDIGDLMRAYEADVERLMPKKGPDAIKSLGESRRIELQDARNLALNLKHFGYILNGEFDPGIQYEIWKVRDGKFVREYPGWFRRDGWTRHWFYQVGNEKIADLGEEPPMFYKQSEADKMARKPKIALEEVSSAKVDKLLGIKAKSPPKKPGESKAAWQKRVLEESWAADPANPKNRPARGSRDSAHASTIEMLAKAGADKARVAVDQKAFDKGVAKLEKRRKAARARAELRREKELGKRADKQRLAAQDRRIADAVKQSNAASKRRAQRPEALAHAAYVAKVTGMPAAVSPKRGSRVVKPSEAEMTLADINRRMRAKRRKK